MATYQEKKLCCRDRWRRHQFGKYLDDVGVSTGIYTSLDCWTAQRRESTVVGTLYGLNRELICNLHQEIACNVGVASFVDA
jgi:hypothetical protein